MKLFNASNTEHKSPVCNYAAALQIKALKTSSGSNVNEAFSPAKQVNGRQFPLKARVLSSSRCVSVPSTSGSIVWHLLTDKTLVKSGWLFIRCLSCCTHTHSSGNQLAEAVLHNFICLPPVKQTRYGDFPSGSCSALNSTEVWTQCFWLQN